MSRNNKMILGIFSLFPIILLIIYFILFYSFFSYLIDQGYGYEPDPREFFRAFMPLLILVLVKVLIVITLLIIFIIDLVNNKKLDSTERIIWILAFIFVGFIAFPLYWYMRIWRDDLKSDTI